MVAFCFILLRLYRLFLIPYNRDMLKSRNRKSTLVISLILALVISTSFCLEFLTMSALAAEFTNISTDSNHPVITINDEMSDVCSPQDTSDQSNRTNNDLISQDNNRGIKDCCLNTDHHPTTAAASDNVLNHHVIATPLIVSTANILTKSFNFYLPTPAPPPETDALRSIVKNE